MPSLPTLGGRVKESDISQEHRLRKGIAKSGATEEDFDPSTLELFYDNILVLRDKDEELTEGGLHKPSSAIEVKHTGVIITVAATMEKVLGKYYDDGSVEGHWPATNLSGLTPGDRIMFAKYHGVELTLNGAPYMIMAATDVIARLPEGVRSDRVE